MFLVIFGCYGILNTKEKQQLDLEILLLNGLTLYKQIQIV